MSDNYQEEEVLVTAGKASWSAPVWHLRAVIIQYVTMTQNLACNKKSS